ncbi:MAG: CDP-alcohol phosphatidyltransferase family protein [Faecalibacterium sp.]|nr:CDP-alcohol phosphatidyltransferase family protein [Ruminococcus sp.]MCM1392637.1 CDP-alcohol phosphatidyltransferase family protein [Ruminococcus sp.]MCM1486358.1 CDP-alcohol phosphatidyltransferase family protein [Faecalibacterium sp.]
MEYDMIKDLFKGCLTIPNLLSVIRIALVPVFAVLFLGDHQIIALVILAVSGLTDLFDGKIARRFNQVSALGKLLDPVADKITQITIAIILFIMFRNADNTVINAFGWVFLVFLIKELVMIVGGLVMLLLNIRPGAAEMPGKVATAAFYGIMILIIGFGPEVGAFRTWFTMPDVLTGILVVISAILCLVAFCSYMPETYRQFKERFSKNNKAD